MARELLPGIALPGLIYFIVSRSAPTMVALAAASSVPLLDTLARLARRKAPSPIALGFLMLTGVSVALAFVFRTPMFVLVKGAVVSAVLGTCFAVSGLIRRPLTRTLALRFSAEHASARSALAERWRHPVALKVFCMLSLGWGAWLLLSGMQQAALAVTAPPGLVVAVEGPVQAFLTGVGILVSVLYVRRFHRSHPELSLLPQRA